MSRRDEHSANLRRQIERTRGTYLMMREAGYDKSKAVRLRFAYRAAPEQKAKDLAEFIRSKTRYVVDVESDGDDWFVHGVTRPSKLNAASLGRWVLWMYRAGYRFDCVFDGWGARVSSDDGPLVGDNPPQERA